MLGEVTLEAENKQWRIIYSVNAMCALEDALSIDTTAIYRRVNKSGPIPVKFLRTLFWGGFYDNHPDITQEAAGRLMQAIGIARTGEIVGKAMAEALAEEAGKPDAGPPMAANAAG